MMRVLVGTLHSEENEFDDCLRALHGQTHSQWEQFIISGLPKKEAHDELFQRFMQHANEHDLFLKLDADMVLSRPTILAEITRVFQHAPSLQMLTIGVHDFFSDRLINGMHVFRSDVRWDMRSNILFTDDHCVPEERTLIDFERLAPGAYHCPDPAPFQAFHFGVHRGLKIRDAAEHGRSVYMKFHVPTLDRIAVGYCMRRDRRLGYACVGAEMALRGDFPPDAVSYTDPSLRLFFDQAIVRLDDGDLARRAAGLWLANRVAVPRLEMAATRGRLEAAARFTLRHVVPRRLAAANKTRT